jgi:curved DNA-binding protein CbpA
LPQGKSLRDFPLAPVEGFVLSRIDGTITERDLVTLTGLDEALVKGALDKLSSLGIVGFDGATPAPRPSQTRLSPATVPPKPVTEISGTDESGRPEPRRGLYDPSELDEDVDLPVEHRRRILDLYYQLDALDHYALLGVPRTAEKKAIKKAYYDLAAVFHPDRYFRKRLGSFKAKMEIVFGRLTQVHDTLTDKAQRAEYDAYLEATATTRKLEHDLDVANLPPLRKSAPPVEAARISATPPPPEPAPTAPEGEKISTPVRNVNVSERARRDALARRLLGGRLGSPSLSPPRPSVAPAPPSPDPEALKRHYLARTTAVRDNIARKHLQVAREAMARSDWVAATTSYKLAVEHAPDDPGLRAELEQAQAKANDVLAEAYRKQAAHEERMGNWVDAARSWTRVARAAPGDVAAHERAAHAILKSGGSLHEAAQLGQRAIQLDPGSVTARATLAEVYLAAGLPLNARREIEAALRLAPSDPHVKDLAKRVEKASQ